MQIRSLLTPVFALALPAYATITTGPEQAIRVGTEPPGATCNLSRDGVLLGSVQATPGAVFVSKSGHDIAINCTMYGRANGAAVISARGQIATAGNLVIGGLLGYGLDLATGSDAEYPRTVKIWMDFLYSSKEDSLVPQQYR